MDTAGNRVAIDTLGRVQVRWGGQAVPLKLRKTLALLLYLALEPGSHDRGRLAGLLWGDLPETRARRNLRHALSQLRRRFSPALLECNRLTVGLNARLVAAVDALTFEDEVEQAGRRRQARDLGAAVRRLETAIGLYQGDFLADFDLPGCPEFEEWAAARQARLREQALGALASLARHYEQRGEYERALHFARRQLTLEPWWEEGHRQVMRLLALLGQRSAALAQYETCRRLLQEELGLEPLEETQELYGRLVDWEIGKLGIATPADDSAQSTNLPIYQSTDLPFIGREDEHAALVAWWQAARRGRGKLALVEGEAGVGKTRLVEKVLRYAESQGAAILRGRCYEFGSEVPYQPIAGALRAILHSPSSILHSPFSILDPVWLAELSRLLPELRQMNPDLPEPLQASGEAARQRLFEAVARFLSASAGHPLCLFLDDLHWADQATLDLLHYLVRRLPSAAPLWIVGAYRPEELTLSQPLTRLRQGLGCDHRLNHLVLKPLGPEAVTKIAHALVGKEAGDALGDRLYRESEGNPFILTETVHDWQDRGALSPGREGLWRWKETPAGALPPGVQYLILQRVGRLSESAQRLLALAAVIGRRFDLALLQAAASDADAVEDGLYEWLDRRLVRPVRHSPSAIRHSLFAIRYSFDFSHDKIRAAVYHALAEGRRRLLHQRVAESLERLHAQQPEVMCEQLAYHYERAGAADPARTYLLLAGDKAAALYAHQEALNFYDRALTLADERQQRDILLRRGRSLYFLNRYQQAEECWRQVSAAGQDLLAVQAANDLGRLYNARRDYDQARHWAERAQRWAAQLDAQTEAAQARQIEGRIEGQQGNLDRARRLFEQALATYRVLGDARGEAEGLMDLGNVALGGGRWAQARSWFEQAMAVYHTLDDRQREARCLQSYGITHWRQENYRAARLALEEALTIYRAIGDRRGEAALLNDLGLIHIVQRDVAETQRCWEQSVSLYRSLGLEKKTASGLHNLGILYLSLGRLDQARRNLEESLALDLAAGDRLNEALDRGWLGRLFLLQGAYDRARRQLEQAVTLDREMGGGEEQVWHHAWLGATAYEMGDLESATVSFREAARLIRQGGVPLGVFEMLWQVAVHLAQSEATAVLEIAQQVRIRAEEQDRPEIEALSCALLGTVYGSGRLNVAEDPVPYFERALALLADDASYNRGTVLRRYGAYLLRSGARQQAEVHLHQAQSLCEQLGAQGELDKVRRLLAGDTDPRLGW